MILHAYKCCNKKEDVRMNSSSGGIFYTLAEKVLTSSGVVYGARFNDDWEVIHDECNDMNNLQAFLTSKYVQSAVGNSFQRVKSHLDDEKMVLFSGTPCQVAGLKSFLGKEYDTLITVDFICHGVPSPKIWREYLDELRNQKEIDFINFRDKTEGWADYSLNIIYKDGTNYRKNLHKDLYMRTYLKDICLRPSCYDCVFKGDNRKADLTLADYWAEIDEDGNATDNQGVSLVLLNTFVGDVFFESIKSRLNYKEVNQEQALRNNKSAVTSVARPSQRTDFFFYKKGKLIPHMRKKTREPIKKQIKRFIRRYIFGK